MLALARQAKVQAYGATLCYAGESGCRAHSNLTIYIIPVTPGVPFWPLHSAWAQFPTYDSTS